VNNLNKTVYLLLLFLLLSCSSNVTINPRGCNGKLLWAKDNFDQAYDFDKKIELWTPFGLFNETKLDLRLILKKENISCEDVEQITLTLTTSKQALLQSLNPFTSTKTLILKGRLKPQNKK
jgi:hypothetical protein